MPGNKGIGTVVSAGAPALGLSAKDAACKAFGASVKAYCGTKPEDRTGTFNDYFFETLEKTKPLGSALAETIKGDATVTAAKPSESIAPPPRSCPTRARRSPRSTRLASPP